MKNNIALTSIILALSGLCLAGLSTASSKTSISYRDCVQMNETLNKEKHCDKLQERMVKFKKYCPDFKIDPIEETEEFKKELEKECPDIYKQEKKHKQ